MVVVPTTESDTSCALNSQRKKIKTIIFLRFFVTFSLKEKNKYDASFLKVHRRRDDNWFANRLAKPITSADQKSFILFVFVCMHDNSRRNRLH